MEFKYLGDREYTDLFGYHFPVNVPVNVTHPTAIAKLSNNSHFARVDSVESMSDEEVEAAGVVAEAIEKGFRIDKRWKPETVEQRAQDFLNEHIEQ